MPHTLTEVLGPVFERKIVDVKAFDLTKQHSGEPVGERIVVSGRVLDENGRPVRDTLIEIWQANAAGRYLHERDQHDAPLDPNFSGCRPHHDRFRKAATASSTISTRRISLGQIPIMRGGRRTFIFPCLGLHSPRVL